MVSRGPFQGVLFSFPGYLWVFCLLFLLFVFYCRGSWPQNLLSYPSKVEGKSFFLPYSLNLNLNVSCAHPRIQPIWWSCQESIWGIPISREPSSLVLEDFCLSHRKRSKNEKTKGLFTQLSETLGTLFGDESIIKVGRERDDQHPPQPPNAHPSGWGSSGQPCPAGTQKLQRYQAAAIPAPALNGGIGSHRNGFRLLWGLVQPTRKMAISPRLTVKKKNTGRKYSKGFSFYIENSLNHCFL